MELPKIPQGLSLKKLLLIGSNRIKPSERDKKYMRAIEVLRKWCGKDPFSRGIMGFSEEIIEKIGKEVLNQAIIDLEERGLGLSPVLLRESLKSRGLNINLGFAELLFSCMKQAGLCITVRAVFPSSSMESKILTFLRIKGSTKFSDIFKKFGCPESAVLNLLKRGFVEVYYKGKPLKLDGVSKFEGLSEREIKGIPDVFLARVKEFDGGFSYRIIIPLSAKVSLKWSY
ncbi:hypothetical protein [Candidatus Methanodesulfokora washburnensis]|jgi:hypothetical protein|uniref:Uncharacterized protein n=1 Tax=Candidatus Methanodesulfokora washburnensis TaxID=2478471 RepID=A0A429GWC3_9CREN|nr:hypothetical protein [Candidatus Methanodesulfokores washburnensis]RSN78055.1 hypothetical protein D6D85_01545 [Candidatus Methanodesulfokores washburnensis]